MPTKRKVCFVACYKSLDYVRIETLHQALKDNKELQIFTARNTRRGLLRYLEVIGKLIKLRLTVNPEIYVISFRGYEILPFVLLVALGKKVVFDEFINLVEWTVYEHHKFSPRSWRARLLRRIYRFFLVRTNRIMTDTESHARYSSELMRIPLGKYSVVPVGVDEKVFRLDRERASQGEFTVLYYGSMLPLHGVSYVIDAAVELKHDPVRLILIGGSAGTAAEVTHAVQRGASIDYHAWVPYRELPEMIRRADVCLGGPFGNTVQSQFVITGKTQQFMALGKPVIVGKNEESAMFKNKKNAIFVEQASSTDLVRAIRWAIENRKNLVSIGQDARSVYEKHFSRKAIERRVRETIEAV